MLQKMMLPSIIQRATSRHLRATAEWYSHELICDAHYRNVEQRVTFPLSLVMVINVFGHNKTNVSTVKFVKRSEGVQQQLMFGEHRIIWNEEMHLCA